MSGEYQLAWVMAIVATVIALTIPTYESRRFAVVRSVSGAVLGVGMLFIAFSGTRAEERLRETEMAALTERVDDAEGGLADVSAELLTTKSALVDKEEELRQVLTRTASERRAAAEAATAAEAALSQALEKVAELECSGDCIITFSDDKKVLFKSDEDKVNDANKDNLAAAIAFIAFRLATGVKAITVYGHTDNTGPASNLAQYNQALSDRRANAVRKYLAAAGIPEDLLKAKGKGMNVPDGMNEPVSPDEIRARNATAAERARNRRVVLSVEYFGKKPKTTPEVAGGAGAP